MVSWFQPVCKVNCFSFLFLKVTSTASQSVVERWKKANALNAAQESVAIIISCELIIVLPVKWMALNTPPSPIWLTFITLTRTSFSFNFVILCTSDQLGEGSFSRATIGVINRWNRLHPFSSLHAEQRIVPELLVRCVLPYLQKNWDHCSFRHKAS